MRTGRSAVGVLLNGYLQPLKKEGFRFRGPAAPQQAQPSCREDDDG